MIHRLSHARLRGLVAGVAGVAALAAPVAVATSASAAATASCRGISFSVLHNDSSGGVILPQGKYTVSSPNLSCQSASSYFTTFLNKYNYAIPGWKGKSIAKGWGTYTKNNTNTQFTVRWSNAKSPAPPAACATSSLKVSLGRANGTAGTTFYPLNFLNKGKSTCSLRGYPGVSAVTSSGKQIGNTARRVSSKYTTVTLTPGRQKSASVGIVETGNFSRSACKPVTAAALKVFPPNQAKAVTLKKSFSTCSSKASTSLQVSPVK